MDCEHLTKNATGNSTFQIKTSYISLPSFLNPPRGSIYYFNYFWKGFSGSNFYNTLPTASFIQTLELDKRRCILSEIGPESIINFKLLRCIKLLLFSKLWVRCLVMVTIPRSQMKVTDGWRRYHHIHQKIETASCCMVVLCPRDDWWGSRFSWLDTSYLNMGVKLIMEKTRASHKALKLEYICGVHALG